MTTNPLSRELHTHGSIARDLSPQRTLVVRTPQRTYGFRYSGLLKWEGTDSKLTLHFTTDDVILHGKELLKTYAAKLAGRRVSTTLRHSGTEISEYFRLS